MSELAVSSVAVCQRVASLLLRLGAVLIRPFYTHRSTDLLDGSDAIDGKAGNAALRIGRITSSATDGW